MLVPDPKTLRQLLTRYATLQIAQAERPSPVASRELEDVTYTLCVMTGTPGIREAVTHADALLARERTVADGRTADPDGENGRCLTV
ncbi:DUF5133 domain-containing protein [Streptomyces sp. KMM 9044]|uniref:DUF5133 domain-containing protein n=1 Tax=Streptomyces sp. KMM 9044 TaxID=2744474 RepID=UPI002151904F|nr:DUF5133 domain-containing protein [Streptomyces sp. KMM 9044]WAX76479.1 DUF5133 domain-containing protein [Streptomyces sp. KMM 9044]